MEGRVIEYRPHGGGLDYHNSPLIGEIPTTDLYNMHRSIDQLRSLNERSNNISSIPTLNTVTDLKSSNIQLEYKIYNNNTGELRSNNQHSHNQQQHHHHHHQQHNNHHNHPQNHDNIEYLKHVNNDNVVGNGVVNDTGVTDVSMLIDEQSDKMDSVLKHVEKQEVDATYNGCPSVSSSPPPITTSGRGRSKGSKKVGGSNFHVFNDCINCQIIKPEIVFAI